LDYVPEHVRDAEREMRFGEPRRLASGSSVVSRARTPNLPLSIRNDMLADVVLAATSAVSKDERERMDDGEWKHHRWCFWKTSASGRVELVAEDAHEIQGRHHAHDLAALGHEDPVNSAAGHHVCHGEEACVRRYLEDDRCHDVAHLGRGGLFDVVVAELARGEARAPQASAQRTVKLA